MLTNGNFLDPSQILQGTFCSGKRFKKKIFRLILKTLNVDDLSNCESIVTIETIDEDFDDQPGKYTNIVEAEANNIAEDETNNVVVPEAEHIVEINTAYENINTDLLNSV